MDSLQLLLWAEVARVPTLLLTAVVCSWVEPGITPGREEEDRGGKREGKETGRRKGRNGEKGREIEKGKKGERKRGE